MCVYSLENYCVCVRPWESGRADTLELAKRVNDYQSRIRGTTRSMMATVSGRDYHLLVRYVSSA